MENGYDDKVNNAALHKRKKRVAMRRNQEMFSLHTLAPYSKGVPHFPQNFEPIGRLAPHFGHILLTCGMVLFCTAPVSRALLEQTALTVERK
jgi:hypothetical protein